MWPKSSLIIDLQIARIYTNFRFAGLLLLFTVTLNTFSQTENIRFHKYTTEHGLSQNMVDCILKDKRGFMWFGTWNGLCRFDGYNFKHYKHEATTPQSLENNFVYSLCEDDYGNLWIGTANGFSIYNYRQEHFLQVKDLIPKSDSIFTFDVNCIIQASDKSIWLGTSRGVYIIPSHEEVYKFDNIITLNNTVPDFPSSDITIEVVYQDSDLNFWIGTASGLYYWRPSDNELKVYETDPSQEGSISSNNIFSIYQDEHKNIWIGTANGLNKLVCDSDQFIKFFYNPQDSRSLLHNSVMCITEDRNKRLLAGTLGGLSIYNESTNNFENHSHNLRSKQGLNNNFINCLYSDNQGNVWIGTERGGINRYNVFQNEFYHIENEPGNKNSLSHNTVNSVYEDEKFLWIGTAGGGINQINKKTGNYRIFMHNAANNTSPSSNFITTILKDSRGDFWFGTWGGGANLLTSYNLASGKFLNYRPLNGDNTNIVSDFVSTIIEDKWGNLWVGSLDGLDVYNLGNREFIHFTLPDEKNELDEVGCLLFDNDENLWIGTVHGLFKINHNTGKPINPNENSYNFYENDPNTEQSLSGNYVISIHEDNNNNLWFGTYGNGLNKLVSDTGKGVFVCYTEADGLSNNIIYTILEDNNQNLWLSTDNGLSKFNPNTLNVRNYYQADGLQNNQFYWSASYKNSEGKFYFGGMNGLDAFFPERIHDYVFNKEVVITDFKIYNESVQIGRKYFGRIVLEEGITGCDALTLSYKTKEFSIEFSSLDFVQSRKNQYAYMLEGFDQHWTKVGHDRRFVSYTNLRGGDYTFKVKRVTDSGDISEPTTLKISIIPPFWTTMWFKLLSATILIGIIILYNRYRTYSLNKQKVLLEKQVSERTKEIELQKEQLLHQAKKLKDSNIKLEHRKELIKSQKIQLERQNKEILDQRDKLIELNKRVSLLNQLKLRFFTNISHEFRTPLTLILGPLEKLLSNKQKDDEDKRALQLINRNAQRLLHLINQLMDFRRIEKGKMDLKVSEGNLRDYLKNILSSFQYLAMKKNIKLNFENSGTPEKLWFDQQKVENIMYNLISNAFKFTPPNGSITVSVQPFKPETKLNDTYGNIAIQYIQIRVSDTGKGISPNELPHIFKRFYRSNTDHEFHTRGSGIGLSLTKELVKTHHGKIYVESELNKGTCFTVLLPSDKAIYTDKEISVSALERPGIMNQVKTLTYEILSQDIENNRNVSLRLKYLKDKPLIIIVEDNHDLREFIAVKLNEQYNILEAENGKVAYELAMNHNPSLIISDVMMPEMDGLELCGKIKENLVTSHIPIILLTARSTIENQIEGLEMGADEYLAKPFDFSLLEAMVANLLESRKRLAKIFSTQKNPGPKEFTSTTTDEKFIQKALEIVNRNINNPDFSVKDLAKELCVSRTLLHNKLTVLTDQSAVDFITSIRLKTSLDLLKSNSGNISDVAYSVGFNDPKYFSRIFRKYYGTTPSEYARNLA